jgi:hypothetical protein
LADFSSTKRKKERFKKVVPIADRENSVPLSWEQKGAPMFRKLFCAIVVVAFAVAVTNAETLKGKITKVSDTKVTFSKMEGKGKDAKFADPKDYTVSKDVKVEKVTGFDKETKKPKLETVEGGLKNKMFTEIGEKGLIATIITNDDNVVTEIRVGGGGKKPKGDK